VPQISNLSGVPNVVDGVARPGRMFLLPTGLKKRSRTSHASHPGLRVETWGTQIRYRTLLGDFDE
jgi:hypothetical protein